MVEQEKTCPICGRKFLTKRKTQVYCSRACSSRYKLNTVAKNVLKCVYCGSEFNPRSMSQRFCSERCKIKYYREHKKSIIKTKLCLYCHKEFNSIRAEHVFCSKSCRDRYKKEHGGEKSDEKKECLCPNCGNPFKLAYPRQKYCDSCHEDIELEKKSRQEVADAENVRKKYGLSVQKYTRRCHDCGKPTNNYRCDKCWQKWRKKNHVAALVPCQADE